MTAPLRQRNGADARTTSASAWLLSRLVDLLVAARRRARLAIVLPALGLVAGITIALLIPSRYPASAAFVPDSDVGRLPLGAGLAGLATQFGLNGGKGESPQFYADLLRNRTILLPILAKRYPAEESGIAAPATLAELLGVERFETPDGREAALRRLSDRLAVSVNPRTNVVGFTVEASTPRLAVAVAHDLLDAVNAFNLQLRQSRAQAQQRFIENRVTASGAELRATEDSLRRFLLSNRQYAGSPTLQFEEARLRRAVDLRQTLYVQLSQQLDQATVDAARNTPTLTVLTTPLPVTKRSYPKRRLIVASSLAASLALLAVVLLALEGADAERDEVITWRSELTRLASIGLPRRRFGVARRTG
jgi:uncharacterized protein involved in exopolysaccharide biosynthesis